jgi:hypothetical protein
MTMTRMTVFAALIAFGAAGAAQAQDAGPRLIGGGDGPQVIYDAPSQNVVGGGYARLTGEGNSRSIAYSGPTKAQPDSGLVASLVGGGREQALVYAPAQAASSSSLAGTQAGRPRG